MEASPDTPPHGELFSHLAPENRERLRHVLAVRVTDVYTAIRGAEAETRRDSSIGRTNLNEAFSHVAELAANTDLSSEEQASHLADIEDHLRRAVMEHPEEVLRDKLVQVQERWDEYLLEARAYREQKAMIGVPMHSELEEDRGAILALMEEARQTKTLRRPWDETLNVAAKMTEAAKTARQLEDKLLQCIGAARELKAKDEADAAERTRADTESARADRAEGRSRKTLGVAVIAVVVALGVGVAGALHGTSTRTRVVTHTVFNRSPPRSNHHRKQR